MAWIYNGRKYWYHNGKRYSRKLGYNIVKKINQYNIDKPYKRALGMTRDEFTRQYNARVAEKFSYENKLKHLGIKKK